MDDDSSIQSFGLTPLAHSSHNMWATRGMRWSVIPPPPGAGGDPTGAVSPAFASACRVVTPAAAEHEIGR